MAGVQFSADHNRKLRFDLATTTPRLGARTTLTASSPAELWRSPVAWRRIALLRRRYGLHMIGSEKRGERGG